MPPFIPPLHHAAPLFPAELLYSAIVIALCLLIYFKTREVFELSAHEGIRYFRHTFLFFILAYGLRIIPVVFGSTHTFHGPEFRPFFQLSMLLFTYASSMAILSLGRSLLWRHLRGVLGHSWPFHVLALILALSPLTLRPGARVASLLLQLLLFMIVITASLVTHHKQTKVSLVNYQLVFAFWILNLFATEAFFSWELRTLLYALSITMFFLLLVRVFQGTRRRS